MSNVEIPAMLAAGGLVLCGGHGLLIRKHGLWDIPKGKTKRRETAEACAVREIAEETGLDCGRLSVRAPLCRTSYISYYSGRPYRKTVTWFLLDYDGDLADPLMPDLSEDIDMCEWVPTAALPDALRTARAYLDAVRPAVVAWVNGAAALGG